MFIGTYLVLRQKGIAYDITGLSSKVQCWTYLKTSSPFIRNNWTQHRVNRTQQRWNRVLFSDESRFAVPFGDGRHRLWSGRGEDILIVLFLREIDSVVEPALFVTASLVIKRPIWLSFEAILQQEDTLLRF